MFDFTTHRFGPGARLPAALGAIAICSLVAACSGKSSPDLPSAPASGSGGAATTSGKASSSATGGSAAGGSGPKCEPPAPAAVGESRTLGTVHAALIDQDGLPAEGVVCTVCGVDLCSGPANSDAKGQVTVKGPGSAQQDPRFNVGYLGGAYAKMAAFIPTLNHDFKTVRVLRLPPYSKGMPIVAGKDATSAGVTLSPPATAVVAIDEILFGDTAQHVFLAAMLDIRAIAAAELPAVDPKLGLEVLIGTGPLDTHICPGAALRFKNVAGWAAGTAVEIYLNGTKTYQNYAPYGQWALVAEAVVDPDGATVTTQPGKGIETLGTFGAKPKK